MCSKCININVRESELKMDKLKRLLYPYLLTLILGAGQVPPLFNDST